MDQVQRRLRERGIEPVLAADEATAGPASVMIVDPDGNVDGRRRHRRDNPHRSAGM